ncbi:GNAT family N-acetyltransferase [Nonomuraea roseoviolacea]|uniref:RimJ/RimL family protein N-acetyltransferase/ubiquinone/menaquinone biosynthesis C-methylase UbiE n=1 Tax=Nonomuraea roseoviolacea subsp. carminata TaxID=160689 RepID=A0ABT1KF12_9ACTN|nr:GNAT family N-acetyltransferase [Nonomuraea roseoviolacea]MCP2352555.1 RimJ/RimL family protein N-acetyltransferase/ubiquinone/menaquinone biosynthesis C-methylase UbiE [Nonomuraea roseoviolacea subsp. carminata]
MRQELRSPDGDVALSPLTMDDAEAHLAGEDAELVRYLNGGPGTPATVGAHLRRCEEQWRAGGPVHAFGVRVGTPPVLAGTVEVQFDQPYLPAGQVNLAYGLYPRWRGRGIATRAVELACLHAASAGATLAVIRVEPENAASAAVAVRAGFAHAGRGEDGFDHYTRPLATTDLVELYTTETSESTRLTRSPHGVLEYRRTRELLRRALTPPPARVLDVGGGTGAHARWLAADGYDVHLVDPVPAHVEAAAALPGVTAEVGDARRLRAPDGSADVVLLLGPLYHLTEAADRARALAEARRVLRPGGVVVAAGISRYLSLLEAGTTGRLTEGMAAAVRHLIATGDYDGHLGFVPAHFHTAAGLRAELESAGLRDVEVYGVEGPAWPALDAAGEGEFDRLVEAAIRCARVAERDPLLINASAHLLAVAR